MAKTKTPSVEEITALSKGKSTTEIIQIWKNYGAIIDLRAAELEATQSSANQELEEINAVKNGK